MNKRTQDRINNNLGIIRPDGKSVGKSRNPRLDKIDKYYKNRQYDSLVDWQEAESCGDEYIPIRKRKPKIIYPLPSVLVDRLASKLLGHDTFPKFKIEEDEETNYLLGLIEKSSMLRSKMIQAVKPMLAAGSSFIRFKLSMGSLIVESYESRYCYPEFDDAGNLSKVEVKYVYEDWEDIDERGKPTEKWYKLEIGPMSDILYDNPLFQADAEPTFTVASSNDHKLGFVQGEWLKTTDDIHSPDGKGLIEPIMSFCDSLNYNLSQTDSATSYGLDPQAVFSGMTEDDLEDLIKSSSKGWALGREGQANFLEVSGSGVNTAKETMGVFDLKVQDTTRIVMLDPEKVVGSAQSAKAMEVLHGPMLDLIYELRPALEKSIVSLMTKMLITLIGYNLKGAPLAITMPPQYRPKSINIEATWGDVFPKTMLDLQQKIMAVTSATNANVISRETGLRQLMKDFNVEDIEMELQKVNTQQQFNTFGF